MSEIEQLKGEIVNLKIRLKRIEEFISCIPNPEIFLDNDEYDRDIMDYDDPFMDESKKIISDFDKVSVSMIQRRLEIGYSRATRIMEQLEKEGYVEHVEGVKPRKVLKRVEKASE